MPEERDCSEFEEKVAEIEAEYSEYEDALRQLEEIASKLFDRVMEARHEFLDDLEGADTPEEELGARLGSGMEAEIIGNELNEVYDAIEGVMAYMFELLDKLGAAIDALEACKCD